MALRGKLGAPLARFSGGTDPQVTLTLRNVGLGPALKVLISGMYIHPDRGEAIPVGAAVKAIGVDEVVQLVVPVRVGEPPGGGIRWETIEFGGKYTDRSLEKTYAVIDARGWTNA